MFKSGDMVKIKLTQQVGMIIKRVHRTMPVGIYKTTYQVRMPDYQIYEFYEFEIHKEGK